MSIAEKLTTIAENQQKVYDAGYAAGQAEGGSNVLQCATNLDYLFNSATFPDGYELTINAPNFMENANRLVRFATGVKKVTLKGNTANNTASLQYAFNSAQSLEIVDASEWGAGGLKPTYFNNTFTDSRALHTILGEIDCSALVNVNSTFGGALALKEIRIKAGTLARSFSFINSSLLSAESIQSIVGGLADLTGAATQTLTLHANIVLTDDQKATISSKNWTLVQ